MTKITNKFKLFLTSIASFLFVNQPIIAQDTKDEDADEGANDSPKLNVGTIVTAAGIAAAIAAATDDDNSSSPAPSPTFPPGSRTLLPSAAPPPRPLKAARMAPKIPPVVAGFSGVSEHPRTPTNTLLLYTASASGSRRLL